MKPRLYNPKSNDNTSLPIISDNLYINIYPISTLIILTPTKLNINNTFRPPQINMTLPTSLYQTDRTEYREEYNPDKTESSATETVNINLSAKKKF